MRDSPRGPPAQPQMHSHLHAHGSGYMGGYSGKMVEIIMMHAGLNSVSEQMVKDTDIWDCFSWHYSRPEEHDTNAGW